MSSCIKLDSTALDRKVGLLGGTFDPVHNGHLVLAQAVHKKLNLDSILFVPAPSPPHKVDYTISPFEDRCRMLDMAIASYHEFYFTMMEQERSGPSYTIDTLLSLCEIFPDTQFYFVIGSDAFADIGTWKKFQDLPKYCHLVVVRRGGESGPDPAATMTQVYPDFVFREKDEVWESSLVSGAVLSLNLPPVDISSTMIRERVGKDQDIVDSVPAYVAQYIKDHHLYTGS